MLFQWRDDGSGVCRGSGRLHFLQHLEHSEQCFALSAWNFIGSESIVREKQKRGTRHSQVPSAGTQAPHSSQALFASSIRLRVAAPESPILFCRVAKVEMDFPDGG